MYQRDTDTKGSNEIIYLKICTLVSRIEIFQSHLSSCYDQPNYMHICWMRVCLPCQNQIPPRNKVKYSYLDWSSLKM